MEIQDQSDSGFFLKQKNWSVSPAELHTHFSEAQKDVDVLVAAGKWDEPVRL